MLKRFPVELETAGSMVFGKILKDVSSDDWINVDKGQKLGHFAYGGAMAILLFQKRSAELDDGAARPTARGIFKLKQT